MFFEGTRITLYLKRGPHYRCSAKFLFGALFSKNEASAILVVLRKPRFQILLVRYYFTSYSLLMTSGSPVRRVTIEMTSERRRAFSFPVLSLS